MKALIIEDDQNLSQTIKEHLSYLFTIEQAYDGEEGLFMAEEGSYDIIILDVMLPNLNGYEVLEKLREQENTTLYLCLLLKMV